MISNDSDIIDAVISILNFGFIYSNYPFDEKHASYLSC
ncbi:hypothetical protein QE390_004965 [Siphonobacter sp. SORGH_AS 1065]|nr:hypothetical protein [Siphonobacter sp. SORGH_AS_1065]